MLPDASSLLHTLSSLRNDTGGVCVVGSANADLTVRVKEIPAGGQTVPGGPLEILPGGKSSNQAAAAARLGASVSFVGAVGSDPNGSVLTGALADAGVDLTHLAELDVPSGTAMILVDEAGENVIIISAGANGEMGEGAVGKHAEAIASAGVLGLCLEIPMDGVLAAARTAKAAGVPVVFNLSPILEVPDELLECVDVLIVNEHELAALVGDGVEPEAGGRELAGLFGIGATVVTLGSAGSVVVRSGAAEQIDTVSIDPVRVDVTDTTGCGDAYMGTLLAGIAAGVDLVEAARLAAVVSAYAATGYGAQASYGSAEEVGGMVRDR